MVCDTYAVAVSSTLKRTTVFASLLHNLTNTQFYLPSLVRLLLTLRKGQCFCSLVI